MLRSWDAPWEVLRSPLTLLRSKGVKGCRGRLVGEAVVGEAVVGEAVVGEAGWEARPEIRMSADENARGLTGVRQGCR